MRMLSRLLSTLLLIGLSSPVWADTDTSTTTLTIAPSASSGATITAADENDRSGDVTTWANAHVHTLPNTTNFGTGSSGSKSLCANAADSTDACIQWNDTANMWTADNPTPGTYNQIATYSTTAGITPNTVVIADGTGALRGVAHGTSGQYLQSAGTGSPVWAAGNTSNVVSFSRTAGAGAGAQSVTGMGFQPTSLFIACSPNGSTDYSSIGFGDDDADEVSIIYDGNVPAWADSATNILGIGAAANSMTAVLTSYGADGFTVTWTKNGAGTDADCVAMGVK